MSGVLAITGDSSKGQFFNQSGGKSECFEISLALSTDRELPDAIPLNVTLQYEGGQTVDNQGILQLMEAPEVTPEKVGSVKARINEVSKNHMGKRFCLLIDIPPSFQKAFGLPSSPVLTDPIKVLSKPSNKKRRQQAAAAARQASAYGGGGHGDDDDDDDDEYAPRAAAAAAAPASRRAPREAARRAAKRTRMADLDEDERASVVAWASHAYEQLAQLAWQEVGYETRVDQNHNEFSDITRPILRCPSCLAFGSAASPGAHAATCRLGRLLQHYLEQAEAGWGTGEPLELPRAPVAAAVAGAEAAVPAKAPRGENSLFPMPEPPYSQMARQAAGTAPRPSAEAAQLLLGGGAVSPRGFRFSATALLADAAAAAGGVAS